MRGAGSWAVIAILVVLHFAFHPLWSQWPAGPNLLLGGLLLGALMMRPARAAALGFGFGVLEASMSLGALGPTILVLALGGYVASWLRTVFYSDPARFTPPLLVFGVWGMEVTLMLVSGGGATALELVVYSALSAVGTAALCWTARKAVEFLGG